MNNKEKKILILSAFVNPFIDNNNRVLSVANEFAKNNWSVEIVTPDFNHSSKKYYSDNIVSQPIVSTTFLHVNSYKNNLSIKRIISHLIFAYKAFFYLKNNIKNYQLLYSTSPTNVAPFLINILTKNKKITHVVDIIDVWPESLYSLSNRGRWLLKILTYPWKLLSHSLYKNASILIAASYKYAEFGQSLRSDKVKAYLLGVDVNKTRELILQSTITIPQKTNDEIWIAYAGNLGYSYDFESVINALVHLSDNKVNYRFFFIGGGVLEGVLSKRIQEKNLNAHITGRVQYRDYLKWLSNCEIAINTFKRGSLVGYSYKFNDYLATGCCVLNNLQGETAFLVENYTIGENFDHEKRPLKEVLFNLVNDKQRINHYRNNTNRLINNELSKEKIYSELFNDLTKDLLECD